MSSLYHIWNARVQSKVMRSARFPTEMPRSKIRDHPQGSGCEALRLGVVLEPLSVGQKRLPCHSCL